jgi:zinc-binding alcohol dehydrogenase family protein
VKANPSVMRAVAVNIDNKTKDFGIDAFVDVELEIPQLKPTDIRVRVKAAAINPIDLKMYRGAKNPGTVLGWDVAGEVESVGVDAKLFQVGDEVYYAGVVTRPGGFSELQVVDEKIVGSKPKKLSFVEAAALPLASITCWEALFEKMGIPQGGANATLLVIGGGGGVGSLAIQLGAGVAGVKVIASASRNETKEQCTAMGASAIVDHSSPLSPQIKALDIKSVDYILCLTDPAPIFADLADIISPQGKICCLVESSVDLPMNLLRTKSVGFSWEGAFTKSLFRTKDMITQHEILNNVAELVDAGTLKTTLSEELESISAINLSKACRKLSEGGVVGKIVINGFN